MKEILAKRHAFHVIVYDKGKVKVLRDVIEMKRLPEWIVGNDGMGCVVEMARYSDRCPKNETGIDFVQTGLDLIGDFCVDILDIVGGKRQAGFMQRVSEGIGQADEDTAQIDLDADDIQCKGFERQQFALASGTGEMADLIAGLSDPALFRQIVGDGSDEGWGQMGGLRDLDA